MLCSLAQILPWTSSFFYSIQRISLISVDLSRGQGQYKQMQCKLNQVSLDKFGQTYNQSKKHYINLNLAIIEMVTFCLMVQSGNSCKGIPDLFCGVKGYSWPGYYIYGTLPKSKQSWPIFIVFRNAFFFLSQFLSQILSWSMILFSYCNCD